MLKVQTDKNTEELFKIMELVNNEEQQDED